MIFFTADQHFGHANIIRHCHRPYRDVEEMNRDLIARWNSRVAGADTVYILGDLFCRCREPEPILRQLKGQKVLIEGNHDSSWLGLVEAERYFRRILPYLEVSDGHRGLVLCHYPLLTYRHESRACMIHGHLHNNTQADFWPLLAARERVLNACAEVNGYQPVPFDELVENNRRFKAAHSAAAP